VINRSDIGDEKLKTYAREKICPSIWKSLLTAAWPRPVLGGKLLVEIMPLWKEKFAQLYRRIKEIQASRQALS
jgi:hypothetical protein